MLKKLPKCSTITLNVQYFKRFSTNVPILDSLKTPENLRFSDVFKGYRSGTLVENGLAQPNTNEAKF